MFISLVLALKSKGPETSAHGVHVRQKRKRKKGGKRRARRRIKGREEEQGEKRGTRLTAAEKAVERKKCEINRAFTIFHYTQVYIFVQN